MSNTNKNLVKLQESFKERDEAKVCLSKYFLDHQDNVPQEIFNAWVEFERLEKKTQTVEAEALKGIEREISERQKVEGETAKSLDRFQSCIHLMMVFLMAELLVGIVVGDFSQQLPEPDFTGCSGSTPFFMC